jgi:hypothetical protein
MSEDRVNEVVEKNGVDYFVQETREGPGKYIGMIRRREHVFDCEKQAVQELPKQEL